MKTKTLKIIQAILGAVAFVSFFALAILGGAEYIGPVLPYLIVAIVLFAGSLLGVQAIENEIEYRQKQAQRMVKRCGR